MRGNLHRSTSLSRDRAISNSRMDFSGWSWLLAFLAISRELLWLLLLASLTIENHPGFFSIQYLLLSQYFCTHPVNFRGHRLRHRPFPRARGIPPMISIEGDAHRAVVISDLRSPQQAVSRSTRRGVQCDHHFRTPSHSMPHISTCCINCQQKLGVRVLFYGALIGKKSVHHAKNVVHMNVTHTDRHITDVCY